jgi:hypothetical protein
MNKQKLIKQAEKLQNELDKLKLEINKPEDVFLVTTYSEVCNKLNKKQETCPYKKIKDLELFFNEGWKKEICNISQYKYYPYFSVRGGSLVFFGSDWHASCFGGCVGLFKNELISNHIGKNFISIYQEIAES